MPPRSLKFNTAMNLLNTAARLAMPFITFPYTSRILGPEGSGKIAFAVATTQWFAFAATAGLSLYASREVARVRHDRQRLAQTALEFAAINAVSVLVAWLAFLGYYFASPRLQQEPTLMLVYGCGLLFCVLDFSWFFQGIEDYRYTTLRNLASQALGCAGIFLLIHQTGDYVWVAWLSLATALLTATANLRHAVRLLWPLPRVSFHPFRFFRPLGFTFAWYLFGAVHMTADVQIVGWLADDRSTGLYNAAVRLNKMSIALLTCLAGVVMPRLTHYLAEGKKDEYHRIGNLSFRFVWTFGLPAVVGIMLLAPDLVQALAGQRFAGAARIMYLMAPLVLLGGLRDFAAGNILYPRQKERWICGFTMLSAVLIVAGGLWLLPDSGHPGQTMGAVLLGVECINTAGLLFLASRLVQLQWVSRGNLLAILNTAIMAAAVWGLHQLLLQSWVSADGLRLSMYAAMRLATCTAAGVGLYFALMFLQRDPLLLGPLKPYLRNLSKSQANGGQDQA